MITFEIIIFLFLMTENTKKTYIKTHVPEVSGLHPLM